MNKKIKVALYEPEIPPNVGSIMRTCSCFGVDLILIEPLGFILEDKKLKRALMDYKINIILLKNISEFFKKYEERKILFTPHSSLKVNNFKFQDNDILLFGRESNGVEIEIAAKCDSLLAIPMQDNCRSLNLSYSVTIGLQLATFYNL